MLDGPIKLAQFATVLQNRHTSIAMAGTPQASAAQQMSPITGQQVPDTVEQAGGDEHAQSRAKEAGGGKSDG